jgi:hypothetical protein
MGEERAPAAASIANIQQPAPVVHPVPMMIQGAASSQGAFHSEMVAAAEAGQCVACPSSVRLLLPETHLL